MDVICLFIECKTQPFIQTPNGLCCEEHYDIFKIEKPSDCIVCMDELTTDDKPLACGHWIHKNCILNCKKLSCPVCRARIYLPREEYLQWKEKHNKIIPHDIPPSIEFPHFNEISNRNLSDLEGLNDIPFNNIRELLPFSGKRFNWGIITQIVNSIGTVYPELNQIEDPETHTLNFLINNGYSLVN
jgi:hypothetical protein